MSDSVNDDVETTVNAIDDQLAHIWMVRTFIKHSDEAVDDEELSGIARDLYDFVIAVAPAKQAEDPEAYLKAAKKKWSKLKTAAQLFTDIQPDVSTHTNFEMAAKSLSLAVQRVEQLLG